jgi:hypothetical protein
VINGLFGFFSNSFLVEAGMNQSCFSEVAFAKFQPKRNETYQIISLEREWNNLVKRPRTAAAKAHLENYERIHEKAAAAGINICTVKKAPSADEWLTEYIDGQSIAQVVNRAGERNGKEGIQEEIRKLIDYLYSVSDIAVLDKPMLEELKILYTEPVYVIKYGLMDLNASNVLYNESRGYTLIDQEWEEPKQVPTDYSIMCSLGYLYSTCPAVRNVYTLNDLLKEFGITLEKVAVLEKISDIYFNMEHAVLDEEKCLIFDGLSHYEVLQSTEQIKLMESQLQERNEQIAHLSKHYQRVVDQIGAMEKQLEEQNKQLTDLSVNYNRVVKILESSKQK